jgi:hypothetical protein
MAGSIERLRTRFSGFWSGSLRPRLLASWEPGPAQLAGALLVLALGVGGAVALVSAGPTPGGVPTADARYAASTTDAPADAARERPLEAWVHDLSDPAPRVRWTAVQALARLGVGGADTDEIVAALVGALKDDHFMVRADAATALGALGPDADDAVSALIAATGDPAAGGRTAATAALPRNPPSPDAVTRR